MEALHGSWRWRHPTLTSSQGRAVVGLQAGRGRGMRCVQASSGRAAVHSYSQCPPCCCCIQGLRPSLPHRT